MTHDQHVVPQVYLKNFANGKTCYVVDSYGKISSKSIEGICYEKDYYELRDSEGVIVHENLFESGLYQKIETKMINEIDKELPSLKESVAKESIESNKNLSKFSSMINLKTIDVHEIKSDSKDEVKSIGFRNDKVYFFPFSIKDKMREYANGHFAESNETDINSFIEEINNYSCDVNNICFFFKEGDVQYTTSISGGSIKGGGSSIGGAIIGGLIAGDAGAIIGSRRKIESEEIKTVENEHDTRVSVITNKSGTVRRFYGFDAYDFWLKNLPEKDLRLVILIT